METSKKEVLAKILEIIIMILYFALGIFTIICVGCKFEATRIFVGIVILLTSIPFLLCFLKEIKDKFPRYLFPILFVITIVVGFLCIFTEIDIGIILVLWGAVEIIRGAYEINHAFNVAESISLKIAETIVGVLEIVFAILLMFKQLGGIPGHLICIGITCIILGGQQLLSLIAENIKK